MRVNLVSIVGPALCVALVGMSAVAAEDPATPAPAAPAPAAPAPAAPAPAAPAPAAPAPATPAPASYPSDDDRYDGDRLKLKVNVSIFEPIGRTGQECAPKGSKLAVLREDGAHLYVRFYEIPDGKKKRVPFITFKEDPDDASLIECGITPEHTIKGDANRFTASANTNATSGANTSTKKPVNIFTQYQVNRAELLKHDFRRTGVTFGGMVVPFKYYLGGDGGKLSSSSTIAPYVGFRGPGPFGLTFTPVVSAGLGLVPVTDADTNETTTKTAFSTAIGARITTTKNDKFNAGLLFGRDFLNKSDRGTDKYVDNVWFSLYVGYKL